MMNNHWIVKPIKETERQPKINLLCFPYAGGGVHIYHSWSKRLAEHIDLYIVQPPGRGNHFTQPPIDNMAELVHELLPQVSHLIQGPYAVFGHSLGSRVGFELVRQAMLKGFAPPVHFFASGSASPSRKCFGKKISQLPEAEFIAEIEQLNGTPAEVLANPQLMELLLPTLRADFNIAENYSCQLGFTIPAPSTVLSGIDDDISRAQLENWGSFFNSSNIAMCEGDHFFIDSHPQQVLDIVNQTLI